MTIELQSRMPQNVTKKEISTAHSITTLAQGSMFWRPVFLEKSEWLEHIPFAFWLIEAHKPSTFVELGTQEGAAYFAMCQAIDRLRLETCCYAVSTWESNGPANKNTNSLYETFKAHNDAHYSSFSRLVKSTSQESLGHFADSSIDLIHFDGLEGYDEGSELIRSWLPKLSDRGLILLHDTNVREKNIQVHRLFQGLKETYPAFEFTHGQGLGLLGVGATQSELTQKLFESDSNNSQVVQDVFSRLGRACADSYSARFSEKNSKKLAEKAEKLKTDLKFLEENLSTTKSALKEKKRQIKQLNQRIQQQVETQALERGQLVERSTMVQNLYDELKTDTKRLRNVADETTSQLREQDKKLFQIAGDKANLEKDTHALKEAKRKLEQLLSDKENINLTLKQSIEEAKKQFQIESDGMRKQLETQKKDAETARQQLADLTHQHDSDQQKLLAELEAQKKDAATARQQLADLTDQHDSDQQKLLAELEVQKKGAETATQQLADLTDQHDSLLKNKKSEIEALKMKNEAQRDSINIRFQEIAILTNLMESKEKEHQNELTFKINEYKNELLSKENKFQNELEAKERVLNGQLLQVRARLASLQRAGNSKFYPRKEIKDHIQLINDSGLFDNQWYLKQYPDIADNPESAKNPVLHYLQLGGFEGRNPSEKFDTLWYLEQNEDVALEGFNPLIHYLLHGISEGRLSKPFSDQA
jgi:rubrerythrin